MGAAGTRERIIAAHRYQPADPKKAERESRVVARGAIQTHKKKGDLVIVNAYVKSYKVTQNGWN